MDTAFLTELMDKTGFPQEAKGFLLKAARAVNEAAPGEMEALTARYLACAAEEVAGKGYGYAVNENQARVEAIAKAAGLSPYTVWFLTLAQAAVPVQEDWAKKGRDPQLFWDTFSDLRCKITECKNVQGVWGNFVAHWYAIFYTDRIFKLGRLEFETARWEREEPYSSGGVTLRKGDFVANIHIPSSGEPFDRAARLDSYRRAWEFFREKRQNGKLACICHSWLLYPGYAPLLTPGSNILSFQKDFDIVQTEVYEQFGDDWRLFGADAARPTADWPENTRMQRSFKKYFLNGGKPGAGLGVLIFDGETLPAG